MRLPLVALAALALAGCGGGDAAEESGGAIDIDVTVFPNGPAGDSITWTLECEPTGGDHPDAEAACAQLTALENPFAEVKPTPRCDEIPGASDEVAIVEGTFRGREIDERFDRSSGCVFERWNRLDAVFPTGL